MLGFFGTIWRALVFIIVCFLLFLIGVAKGIIIGPPAFIVLVAGHAAVTIGLWPVHVVMTYYTVAKAKKLGPSAKVLSFICLPIPLLLWPVVAIVGSILVGIGYGFITPLVATFEAVGADRDRKTYHCFADGTWSILKGSCTVVRDFTDLSYHSFMDYLKDFREKTPKDGQAYNIKMLEIPGCVLVGLLGVLLDVPVVSGVALAKSPIMLIKGWQRLLKDLWGRQGPFLEAFCVPFAGLAIVLWPLVVVASFVSAVLASPFLGLYGAVVVYQERSVQRGLAYIVNVLAQFDEYSNDALHLREGSCFPRPKYRDQDEPIAVEVGPPKTFSEVQRDLQKTMSQQQEPTGQQRPELIGQQQSESVQTGQTETGEEVKPEQNIEGQKQATINEGGSSGPSPARIGKSSSQAGNLLAPSKSLRKAFGEVKVVQVWDDLFKGLEVVGHELVREGVIKVADIEEWLRASKKDKSKLISIGLPASSTLNKVFYTAKSGAGGILLYDGTEITKANKPQDRLGDWLFDPVVILKEQVRVANLTHSEEQYMKKWILTSGDPALLDSWQNGGIEPEENIRRGELQAICRRLQGIATSYSRLPTFPRRFQKYVQSLLVFAQSQQATANPPQGEEAV